MATATSIIEAAYRKIGHKYPDGNDIVDAFENLNNLVSSLGAEFLNYYWIRESLILVIGTAEYTIGASGNLDTVRPLSIKNAFIRTSDGTDHSLKIIGLVEYNKITIKAADNMPDAVYFIPEYPLAKIIFNYKPDKVYTVYFDFEKNLTEFATQATTVSLPNEYKEMLVYNLALTLAEDKGVAVRSSIIETAYRTRDNIGRLKAINMPVPESAFEFKSQFKNNIITGT